MNMYPVALDKNVFYIVIPGVQFPCFPTLNYLGKSVAYPTGPQLVVKTYRLHLQYKHLLKKKKKIFLFYCRFKSRKYWRMYNTY